MRRTLSLLLTVAMTIALLSPATYALAEDLNDNASPEELQQNDPDDAFEEEPDLANGTPPNSDGQNNPGALMPQSALSPANDSETIGTSVINLESGFVVPNNYRDAWQDTGYGSAGWISLPYWGSGAAELLNANGDVVRTATGNARISFAELPAGTYTIRLTPLDWGPYLTVAGVTNGGPMSNLLTDYETQVTVEDDQTVTYVVVYEYKAYGFATTTSIGTFENGSTTKTYFEGWNKSFPNPDSTTSARTPIVNSHNGIYHGDSASLYKKMNDLEVPTLSEEEAAKGYTFAGWKLVGDESNKVYTTDEVLAYVVKSNVVFEAVWEVPTHTVTFSTNTDYGTIGGKDSYSVQKEFNNQTVGTLPTVDAKEDYEFIGWFSDLTTNVIPENEISQTVVNRDLNYYAKYRQKENGPIHDARHHTVKFVGGTDGDLSGTDSLTLTAGSKIPVTPHVSAHDHATFISKWQVIALSDDAKHIKEGDVFTEDQIHRIEINFDVIFEALYERNYYTVTYLDGANNTAFLPLVTQDVEHGSDTPAFEGTPERDGHEFIGWDKHIKQTVTEDAVYTAQWKVAPESAEPAPSNQDTTQNSDAGQDPKDGTDQKQEAGTTPGTNQKSEDATTQKPDSSTSATAATTKPSTDASSPAAKTTTTHTVTTSPATVYTSGDSSSHVGLAKTGDRSVEVALIGVLGLVATGVGVLSAKRRESKQ